MNKYKSGFERKTVKNLQRRRVKFFYEKGKHPYVLIKNYVDDFTILTKSGKVILVEVKGYLRPEDRTKLIAVKKCNPDLDLRLLFWTDNKLNKNSRMRYSDWATKNGFKFAFKTVPQEWLDE